MFLAIVVAVTCHGISGCRAIGVDNKLNEVPIGRPLGKALVNLDRIRSNTGSKLEKKINSLCTIGLQNGCPKFAKGFRLIFGFS